jgi:hypothetical protein
MLTTYPLLALRLRMSRAITLLPPRPLVACYRMTFTFYVTKNNRTVIDQLIVVLKASHWGCQIKM